MVSADLAIHLQSNITVVSSRICQRLFVLTRAGSFGGLSWFPSTDVLAQPCRRGCRVGYSGLVVSRVMQSDLSAHVAICWSCRVRTGMPNQASGTMYSCIMMVADCMSTPDEILQNIVRCILIFPSTPTVSFRCCRQSPRSTF